jgi:hypothetical protein
MMIKSGWISFLFSVTYFFGAGHVLIPNIE